MNPGHSLTSCAAAQLIIDTAGFMTFAADDAQAAGCHDLVMELLPLRLHLSDALRFFFCGKRFVSFNRTYSPC